jgi:exosortase
VQKLATAQTLTDSSPLSRKQQLPLALALSLLFLAALWFGLCRELSGEWSVNEQYSFGWFVPFFAVYIFWLRWQDRPTPEVRSQKLEVRSRLVAAIIGLAALLLLLPARLFEIANPEWRLLAWIHALAVVTLTLLLFWKAGGKPWLRHFAFPVAFTFIAVPWPTLLETPVIQGLMRMVAHVAAETAMLLGIPAQVEGNLIRVSSGLVGVNEACSGIRSLQTSLMIGLLFGELKRFSALWRVVLVGGAVAIALSANFLRAVFLVCVAATRNISEISRWHDIAGYTIVAVVFVGTMVLAYWLGRAEVRGKKSDVRSQISNVTSPSSVIRARYLVAAVCWLLFVEVGTAAWYRVHETNLVSAPRWSVRWPEKAPNFQHLKIDEEIRGVLRFDEGEGAAWTIASRPNSEASGDSEVFETQLNGSKPNTISCLLYLFRWKPGRNSALLANLHRPDVCLPASGWTQVADHGVRSYPISDSVEMPFRHFEFQRSFEGSPPETAHAFYCLSEDRASGGFASLGNTDSPGMFGNRSEWTRSERLRAVLDGRRHLGQQVIEAIFISSEPLSAAEAETHLRDFVRDVVRFREAN